MQIGNIRLGAPVALAPMAGITDMPFRVICKELGCGLVVSEMVSAKGLLYKNVKTFDMLRIAPEERPAAIQLFGSVPQELARAAKIVEADGAEIVDFNMGCPVPKIVNNGEGSALMKNPQLAYEILARMADAVKIPVTVKIRAGWDADHINAPEIAQLAEKAGVAAIAVHGRTREQFYNGKADWGVIKAVKDAVAKEGKFLVLFTPDMLKNEMIMRAIMLIADRKGECVLIKLKGDNEIYDSKILRYYFGTKISSCIEIDREITAGQLKEIYGKLKR